MSNEQEPAIARAVKAAGGQQKLADVLDVTQGRISQWVSGEPIPLKHFQAIEDATGVTAQDLLADEMGKAAQSA